MEKLFEIKLKEFTGGYLRCLDKRFGRIEKMMESKIDERINRYHLEFVGECVKNHFESRLPKMFSSAFENKVTPTVEKQVTKVFENVNNSFEKGNQFFQNKLSIEQKKANHMRETLNEIMRLYLEISNGLTQTAASNQSNYQRKEAIFRIIKIKF